MPPPPDRAARQRRSADLRGRAAARLTGAAATLGHPARAADAMAAIQTLALNPQTATEALALLHELQVHQVELELQAQELRESRAGLESDLRHYADLYRLQPAALLTLDAQRRLYEMNPAASALLGVSSEHAIGRPIDAYFCPDSVHRLATALAQAAAGVAPPPGALRLTLRPRSGPPCAVLLALGPDAVAQRHIASLLRAD